MNVALCIAVLQICECFQFIVLAQVLVINPCNCLIGPNNVIVRQFFSSGENCITLYPTTGRLTPAGLGAKRKKGAVIPILSCSVNTQAFLFI